MIDDTYAKWAARRDVNPCPKCKVPVEKNEGCQHMTCAMCRYQWCWICGEKYTHRHYDLTNFRGCINMQYSTNKLGCLFLQLFLVLLLLPIIILVVAAGTILSKNNECMEVWPCNCCFWTVIIVQVPAALAIGLTLGAVILPFVYPILLFRFGRLLLRTTCRLCRSGKCC